VSEFKTSLVCDRFAFSARLLTSVGHYNTNHTFEGLALPILPEGGREQLNEMLLQDAKDHVVVIDGMHHGNYAVFGKQEAASARAGGARAVIVLGHVAHAAALQKDLLPIMARSTNPRLISATGGSARLRAVEAECGMITREDYIIGDSDGAVLVEHQIYQQKMRLK